MSTFKMLRQVYHRIEVPLQGPSSSLYLSRYTLLVTTTMKEIFDVESNLALSKNWFISCNTCYMNITCYILYFKAIIDSFLGARTSIC